jgi:hypothetical protein
MELALASIASNEQISLAPPTSQVTPPPGPLRGANSAGTYLG